MLAVANGRWNFSVSARTKTIVPTARESRFGRTRGKKWIRFRNSCATLAVKTLRVPKFARTTVRVTTPSFSRTPMATNSKFAVARSRYLPLNPQAAVPAATIAILQVTRLPLHLGSGRFKNEEPGASRTCHFAGSASPSLSQADRAVQDCQRRAAACAWYLTAFSECADQMDGCLIGLDCGRNP